MKLLLLNPPFLQKYSRSSRSPAVTKSGTIYYPLWLAHAAGLLEKKGHSVLLIDVPARGGELLEYKDRIKAFEPGIVVIDTSTPSIESDVRCMEKIKAWLEKPVIGVLVGSHPTVKVEETFLLSNCIDVIARGEYDWTLCELAKNVSNICFVAGISWRDGENIVHNPDRPYVDNLDEIPFVSDVYKRHLNINDYFYAHCRNPTVSIFAGRGCPNCCSYCVYPQVMFGHRYRHRSVIHFVDELEYIQQKLPEVREILIDDDNLSADQDFLVDICDEIVRRRLSVVWTAEVRVSLKREVMKRMKVAGCRLLVAGFESGSQEILNNIRKAISLEDSCRFMTNARKEGLRVHGCFMVGNQGETRKTMEETLEFALNLNPDTAQFFPLMVYPGTEAYAWAEKNEYITSSCYRDWLTEEGLHACVVRTEYVSPGELIAFCNYARRRFYLRPEYLLRRCLDLIVNPKEIGRTFKAASVLAKHLVWMRGN